MAASVKLWDTHRDLGPQSKEMSVVVHSPLLFGRDMPQGQSTYLVFSKPSPQEMTSSQSEWRDP